MFSPALRNRQKVLSRLAGEADAADQATLAPPSPDTDAGREYASLRVALHEDLRKLADVASIEARNPMKAEMAATYTHWIDGVLEAGEQGQASQDEILVTNMIWAIDYRDFDYALHIAAHAMKFSLVLPERYNRTVACFVAEEIATIALGSHEAVTLEHLMQAHALTLAADMPDPARAKLHKALGRAWERRADAFDPAADNAPAGGKAAYAVEAATHFARALELYRDIGVKEDIKRVARTLKALEQPPTQGDAQGERNKPAPRPAKQPRKPAKAKRNSETPHGARGADGGAGNPGGSTAKPSPPPDNHQD